MQTTFKHGPRSSTKKIESGITCTTETLKRMLHYTHM